MEKKIETRFERLLRMAQSSGGARTASDLMVTLQAVSLVSTFVNYFRIQVAENEFSALYPSTLILIEAPTGAGKNAAYRFMKTHLLGNAFKKMEEELHIIEKKREEELEEYVLRMWPDSEDAGEQKKVEKARNACRSEFKSKKRALAMVTPDDGSYEGFAFDRAYLGSFPCGAPTIRVDEYGDKLTLMSRAAYLQNFYNRLLELVDYDKLGAKSIKAREGETPGSEGMGISLYFTLSHPDERQKEDIKRAVLKSIGRRGFIVRETNQTITLRDFPKNDVYEVEAFSFEMEELMDHLFSIYGGDNLGGRFVRLSPNAQELYEKLSKENEAAVENIRRTMASSKEKDVKCALMQDLDRKVLKLSALLAVFNHGEKDMNINLEDIVSAKRIVDLSHASASSFFDMTDYSSTNKFIAFLQERPEKRASSLEIVEAGLFEQVSKRAFQGPLFDLIMGEVKDQAEESGFTISHSKIKNRDFYSLTKVEHAEEVPPVAHFFSYQKGLDISSAEGFKVSERIEVLPKLLQGEYLYSAADFSGGKRKQENFLRASLIILDFDSGLTIAEAKEKFSGFKYIIATTRSHQKEKHGVTCDRFRVILFADQVIESREDFRSLMQELTLMYGSDPACKDAARAFFTAPDCQVYENSGALFPIADALAEARRKERVRRDEAMRRIASGEARGVDSFMIYDKTGTPYDAATFIGMLPQDGTTRPVKCPWHEDSVASAFVSHTKNGGLQITCIVCGETKFIRKQ